MDKIVNVTEELSTMLVTLKDGTSIPVKAKTIDTYWASGRKDCHIELQDSINTISKKEK